MTLVKKEVTIYLGSQKTIARKVDLKKTALSNQETIMIILHLFQENFCKLFYWHN